MEEFKVAKLPKTQNENFNISSVAKFITTTGGLVSSENPTELKVMPSKNIIVTVDLEKDKDVKLSSNNVTMYDLAVMDSVYTLYKNNCSSFTPEMISRIMSGNMKGDVKPQKAGAVTRSRGIKLRKGDKALFTDYLLPLREVQVKSANGEVYLNGFSLKEMPVLYDYAERIGRIAAVPISLMKVPGMTDTDDAILVKRYVIQRVEELKRARNKVALKEVIYYDEELDKGVLTELWYDEEFVNIRDKKAKLHKMMIKVLESFKTEKYIKGYDILSAGRSIIGVEINL